MSQCRPVIGFSSQGELTSVKLASYSASYPASVSDFSQNTFKCQVWDAEYEYDLCFYVQAHLQGQIQGQRTGYRIKSRNTATLVIESLITHVVSASA